MCSWFLPLQKKSLLEKVREWALYAEPRQPTFLLIIPTDNAVFQFLVWAYRTITGTEEDGGEEEDDEDAPSDLLPGMKHSLVATWAKMLDLVLKNR